MSYGSNGEARGHATRVALHTAFGIDAGYSASPSGSPREDELLKPSEPLKIARRFIADKHSHPDGPTLVNASETLYRFDGACYREMPDAALRNELYLYLERQMLRNRDGLPTMFNPTRRVVDDIVDALKAVTHADAVSPQWLTNNPSLPDAGRLLVAPNGILDVHDTSGRGFRESTPNLFATNAIDFEYNPHAPEPREWNKFLGEVFPGDFESIGLLRQFMGYSLTADTSQQKALLLLGPPRSGKGTIARVWSGMLGASSVVNPTLSSLATNFGLAPLLGKRLAIVSDARLSGRTDQAVITERLLSIIGEDAMTVDQKYRRPFTGRLPVRFLILTNELPQLLDSSGALANRFLIVPMRESYLGREDTCLTNRLLRELPGILLWSLEGLRTLEAVGKFQQTPAGTRAVEDLMDLGSPIKLFVRDLCRIGRGMRTPVKALYEAWVRWCKQQGRNDPGTVQTFSRDLRAAVPGLDMTQPTLGGERVRCFEGIGLIGTDGLV